VIPDTSAVFPDDPLVIAGRSFTSRLLLGTGKFPSSASMAAAAEAAGAEIVTVALRRMDLDARGHHLPPAADAADDDDILTALDKSKFLILTNTSGAVDADEAVRLARLARAAGLPDWIKLEVTPDPRYLLPDPVETLRAAERLVAEGFVVLPYINADPVLAKHLEEAGCATVMPLGSWIGSNQGLRARAGIEIIVEQALVPVVVDAGIGAPSHAAEAMEIGADAVLVNTAIGTAADPVAMAAAFRLAVAAGRAGYRAGLPAARTAADASSPLTGFLDTPPVPSAHR
jgi:thiazole synthase